MKPKSDDKGRYVLRVPVDASGIEDRSEIKALKAVLMGKEGVVAASGVKLGRDGTGIAEFKLDRPISGRVIVGPPDADDDEMQGLQTLSVDVSARLWAGQAALTLERLVVQPWYWAWWLRWCRTFTIRGRLTCPDGSPVPGAEVCAFDVDRFWWWCSKQQVGCATTDENGNFTIRFRWCCGWWPWWWWQTRHWQIDPKTLGVIEKLVSRVPGLNERPKLDPVPDFAALEHVIGGEVGRTRPSRKITDPGKLDALRPALLEKLPHAPEMEALRIWPWAPWHPWSDCTPDIIFRATQDCGNGAVVVLDETCGDARWNIPTSLDVTLVSNSLACCAEPRPPECDEDGCIVLSHICDDLVATIGGNLGAQATPEGYRNPSPAVPVGSVFSYDRPYAGTVPIKGVCVNWIDYFAFEYSGDGGATWAALPPGSTGGVSRTYFDPATLSFQTVVFNFSTVDGQWVAETLGHWEAANGAKIWVGDFMRLINWKTATLISDGTYHLRLRAYSEVGGSLTDLGIPTLCGSQDDNGVVVAIDNRLVGPGAGHPTSPSHPVPPGGVHIETTEPDTDFVSISVGGVAVGPCGHIDRNAISVANPLVIDFLAHDPDGHLALYTMRANWGENNGLDLLAAGTLSLVAADFIGPRYGAALLQGASAPKWEGGRLRLTITDGEAAFPEPCCYLLDLRAYKRTIVSCDEDYNHRNRSTMTLSAT